MYTIFDAIQSTAPTYPRREDLLRKPAPATRRPGPAIHVEQADDPVWNERGRQLYEFLAKPRTWQEMCGWARQLPGVGVDRLRHVIAHIDPLVRVTGRKQARRWSQAISSRRSPGYDSEQDLDSNEVDTDE